MPVSLRVTANAASADGTKPPPTEHKLDGESISIGRDKGATLVLAEPSVSRNHARITKEGSLYFVEDVGSAFGTRVNGQVLPKGEKRLLRNGDVIAVGTFDIAFQRVLEVTGGTTENGHEKTAAMARAVMKDVMRGLAGGSSPYLTVLNGPHKDDKHEVNEAQELTVGRADECDIIFADDLTSRKHAKIRRDWSGTHVEDLGSRNGVKVNKKLIKGPTTLKDRDELEIGGTRMLYVDPSEIREAPFVPPQTDPGLVPPEEPPPRVPRRPKSGANAQVEPRDQKPPEPAPEPEAPHEAEPPPSEEVSDPPVPEALHEEPAPPDDEEPPPDDEPAPASALDRLRSRVPLPANAGDLKRFVPLFIVGGIAIAAIVVLIWIFVGV